MTRRSEWLSAELEDYVVSHSARPDDLLEQLAAETAASWPDAAGMQIGPEQGTLMTMLARLTGARRALEIGTFTGYS
jgi:caffeoyl-CoA O-methyltransferase